MSGVNQDEAELWLRAHIERNVRVSQIEVLSVSESAQEIVARGADPDSYLSVFISPYETIVTAGVRSRFELDALSKAFYYCVEVVDAILNGGLTEFAARKKSTYTLDLAAGAIKGSVSGGGHLVPDSPRRVTPFAA